MLVVIWGRVAGAGRGSIGGTGIGTVMVMYALVAAEDPDLKGHKYIY